MGEKAPASIQGALEVVVTWSRYLAAIVFILGVVASAWAQFVGDGVRAAIRDFIGIPLIIHRIEQLETFMPAPRVVEWNEPGSRQAGACTYQRCEYILTGQRTPYGLQCGEVARAVPFIRTASGQTFQISYRDFTPVKLGAMPLTFDVPLKVPRHIDPGAHFWRTTVTYEGCPGLNEPVPRHTPWLPLDVSQPAP